MLTGLGYQIERRRHRGYLARHDGRPIVVIHPVREAGEFSRLDADGRPPEGLLLNDCQADGAPFGVLAAGTRLRLFEADPQVGSAASKYADLDSAALQVDDFPFLALLSPEYLAHGEFAALQEEARNFGTGLRRRLDATIRQTVLPTLGRALGKWSASRRQDASADEVREELERAALTLVFRALFILYAESAGYLPMDNRSYRQSSLTSLVDEAADSRDRLGMRSTSLWDRFVLLVKAMRTSNPAWGVPAYNGALFAADGFEGAATLEAASFADPDFATILIGLGRDPETGAGLDYSTLEIGHLGHIYEGLLSLRLSAADSPLVYDVAKDRYVAPSDGAVPDVEPGDLLWQTHEGGRKGGGVYYTRTELVEHLVRGAVVPAFTAHLARVRERAAKDPAGAARELFDFAVLDPACGSAHFLVVVVNEIADMVVKFLGDTPLPEVGSALERLRTGASPGAVIEDVALLRRLVLKRCVFGVDVSPMGAEVATLSLWLTSFVPGLSLAYLGRNVVVGDSLVGVARPEALRAGHPDRPALWDDALARALAAGTEAALRVAEGDDRNPDEYEASEADRRADPGRLLRPRPAGHRQPRPAVPIRHPLLRLLPGPARVAEPARDRATEVVGRQGPGGRPGHRRAAPPAPAVSERMNVSFASAKGSGSANEDWVGATASIAVVLDGITTPPGMADTGCTHGTPWLVSTVGSNLILQTEQRPDLGLAEILREAITSTAARHAHTCNLDAPGTPSAALDILRTTAQSVEYLVLSDAFLILDTGDEVHVVEDLRGHDVVADRRAATFAHPIGTEEHTRNRRKMVDLQRLHRNVPEGYWVVAGKPEAADHAVTGLLPRSDVHRAAVLTDGAASLVEFGLTDWKGVLDILEHEGPTALIHRVREAERSDPNGTRWPRFKPSDDATAAFIRAD